MMIRARIKSTVGGFAQLDSVVQAKQKELIKALVIPRYHVYFIVQANISEENGAQFQLNFIKKHFEDTSELLKNLCVCVSDKSGKTIAHHLNKHGALCMVFCGHGTDHLNQTSFSFKRFLVRCPRVVIICMPIGAKTAANAALKAGAQTAIWFQFDISDLAPFKLFFKRVLLSFLEEALQLNSKSSQRTCLKEAKQSIQQLLDAAQRKKPTLEICQFGIEFDTDLALDESLLPQELCPPSQAQGCVDVEFQASLKGNFASEGNKAALLACDAKTLAEATDALCCSQSQHLYLGSKPMLSKPNLETDAETELKPMMQHRYRAIAQHLCWKAYHSRCFDAIYHIRVDAKTNPGTNIADACLELEDDAIEGALLWLDVTTDTFLDEIKQEFKRCAVLHKVFTVVTDSSLQGNPMKYIEACEEEFEQEFKILPCNQEDDGGIEASDLQTDIRMSGIASVDGEFVTHSAETIKRVLESMVNEGALKCCVRGLLLEDLEDGGAAIARIQILDVLFLHKIRDCILTGLADVHLESKLNTEIKCDRSHFAKAYESLSLQLNKPTTDQRRVLEEIYVHLKVHLRALAGAGKTFVILSVLEDAFRDDPNVRILLVSKTKALVLFIASWLWQRTKPRCLRENRIRQLHVMYDPLAVGRYCIAFNEETGMLETRAFEGHAQYTFLILDEAHHCCSTAEQHDLIMRHVSAETKILMCSDLSQA